MVPGVFSKLRFQTIDKRVVAIADFPQEFGAIRQILQMFMSNLFSVEKDIERWIQERKPKIKRDDLCQEGKTVPYPLFHIFEVNYRAVFMSRRIFFERRR